MNPVSLPAERNTRQKAVIHQVLEQAARPLLPQEILDVARHQVARLSLATVYRNLKSMMEEGVVSAVNLPGQSTRFEMTRHHHHHFHCRHCQRVYDIDACPGNLAHLLPQGYQLEDHELVLYGACAACACTSHE